MEPLCWGDNKLLIEIRNPEDCCTVVLQKDGIIIGHAPHTISCVCTLVLRCGGTVTGLRKYSDDLLQGGLKLPCTYQFTGPDDVTKKVHQLLLDDQDGVSDLATFYKIWYGSATR